MSGYYFEEKHELFRSSLKSFINKEVVPYIEEWENNRAIPDSIWKKLSARRLNRSK